jgi:hypothetical protein
MAQLGQNVAARKQGGPATWMFPAPVENDGWSGSLFDLTGIAERFNRDAVTQQFSAAISDADDSGIVLDLEAGVIQAELLAMLERSFLNRHMSRPRMVAHTLARHASHADGAGTFGKSILTWLSDLMKQASS